MCVCVCVCVCVCFRLIYIYIYIHTHRPICIMLKVFASVSGDQGSIPGQVIPKTQKWYLMPLRILWYRSRYRVSEAIQGKE